MVKPSRKYRSKAEYHAVEVSPETRDMVDRVNEATHIPKRHLVNMTLAEALRAKYPDVLAATE